MKQYIFLLILYFVIISIISIIVTIKDKKAAIKHNWRVPESALMLLGLSGGATAMFITMKKIRHKTKHIKFMLGLPAEIILHIAILVFIFIKL